MLGIQRQQNLEEGKRQKWPESLVGLFTFAFCLLTFDFCLPALCLPALGDEPFCERGVIRIVKPQPYDEFDHWLPEANSKIR